VQRTDQEVIARNAAEVTENEGPVQGSSDVSATRRLFSILSEFHLTDEIDQLAKDGIKSEIDLRYLNDYVITGCNVTPLAKGKLKRLAASLT
jgi:hypothetical protein